MNTLPSDFQTPPPDLRPLGIGELIDRAAHGWRRHFGTLFKLYLAFQLVAFIGGKAFELSMAKWFPLVRGGLPMARAINDGRQSELFGQYALFFAFGVPLLLFGSWLGWLVGVAGSRYFIRKHLGEQATLADGIARMRARLGTITGVFFLSVGWVTLALILSALPGAALAVVGILIDEPVPSAILALLGVFLSFLGVIAALVLYVLRFLFTSQIVAMEDVGAREAVRRSKQLVSGRVGPGFLDRVKVRATLLLTIVTAILVVVSLTAGIPATIIHFIYMQPFDPANADPDAVPQLLLVPAQLLQTLAQAAFAPLFMVVSALFYVDMRVRREGLDLELKLGR